MREIMNATCGMLVQGAVLLRYPKIKSAGDFAVLDSFSSLILSFFMKLLQSLTFSVKNHFFLGYAAQIWCTERFRLLLAIRFFFLWCFDLRKDMLDV